jgi:hypothetical protein
MEGYTPEKFLRIPTGEVRIFLDPIVKEPLTPKKIEPKQSDWENFFKPIMKDGVKQPDWEKFCIPLEDEEKLETFLKWVTKQMFQTQINLYESFNRGWNANSEKEKTLKEGLEYRAFMFGFLEACIYLQEFFKFIRTASGIWKQYLTEEMKIPCKLDPDCKKDIF